MKRFFAASALLLAVAAATTGCTDPAFTYKTDTTMTPSAAATASGRTYTAKDLTAILMAVNKDLKVSGKVVTDTQLKAAAKSAGVDTGGLAALFGGAPVSYEPKECGDLIGSALSTAPDSKGISADLLYNTTTVTAISEAASALPLTAATDLSKRRDFLKKCGAVTLKVGAGDAAATAKLTLTTVKVATKADETYGLSETVSVSSGSSTTKMAVKVTLVQARTGNLYVVAASTAAGKPAATAASLATMVDRVFAAAKALKMP